MDSQLSVPGYGRRYPTEMKTPIILSSLLAIGVVASFANINRFELQLDRNRTSNPLSFTEHEIYRSRTIRGWPLASYAFGGGNTLAKLHLTGPLGGEHTWAVESTNLAAWLLLILLANLVTGATLVASLFAATNRLSVGRARMPKFTIASMLFATMLVAIVLAFRQDFPTLAYLAGVSGFYYEPTRVLYYASIFIMLLAIGSVLVNAAHFGSNFLGSIPKAESG
ncbi:hypothetical protein [Rhodopirellula sallentina]|uniref:Membrane protein n=1 Tax=Rhodopirellula sallentina SM41 TaxID=1263870 RepID=M5U8E1_9BACT|nr:hypothetical protein [Rhodopirellula sallentina]EMI54141.1 membrane protein [Rhodopirellula sallentina SM41]